MPTKQKREMKKSLLENAREMSTKHPDSFYYPTAGELNQINSECIVKVCASAERFWVLVTEVKGIKITGIVDNILLCTDLHGYEQGDKISLTTDNIYQIYQAPN